MGRGRKAKPCAPKKSGREEKAAALAAAAAEGASSDGEAGGGGTITAATGRLPMANLVRLMRQVIPKRVKLSSRAKDLTNDCAVEFVGFLAGEAAERARAQRRRTIAPEDFAFSFQALGFDDYVEPMTTYISRYREQINPAAAYRGFARRRPPPPATTTVAADVTPAPCVSDEETRRRVRPRGEYGDGGSTSVVHAPTSSAHFSPDKGNYIGLVS